MVDALSTAKINPLTTKVGIHVLYNVLSHNFKNLQEKKCRAEINMAINKSDPHNNLKQSK